MPTKTMTITADPDVVANLPLDERLRWYFGITREVVREFRLLPETEQRSEANDERP